MKKKLLIDLDGTILNGAIPINQSPEFFTCLEKMGIDYMVMTNSVKSPMLIKKRLSLSGIEIPLISILNPIIAINSYLSGNDIERAFIVGGEEESIQVRASHSSDDPEIILLLDFEKENLSFSQLQEIFLLMQKGIPAIAASGSPFYMSAGKRVLDTGAFVNLLQSANKSKIEVFGKPSKFYFSEAMRILDCEPSDTIVIGDDWSTDGRGAIECGCKALLVKSGKYQPGDEDQLSEIETIESLMSVLHHL